LKDTKRWNRQKLEEIAATRRTHWVHLGEPLPVILAYWTAEAGENGEVMFREDFYGRDARILSALDGNGPLHIVYREPATPEPTAHTRPIERDQSASAVRLKEMSHRLPQEQAVAAY